MTDSEVFNAIVDAIRGTRRFAAVRFGRAPEVSGSIGSADLPLAWIKPRRWKIVDNEDPPCRIRVVTFEVALVVAADQGYRGETRLEALALAVSDLLTDSDHGGRTLPGLSTALEGAWPDRADYPNLTAIVTGTFAYFLDPSIGN